MRVFVDTNVWLSGRFRPGLCADLLETLLEVDAEILLDERVLAEFRRIARDKLGVDEPALARAEQFFRHFTTVLPAAGEPAAGIPDADDAWIIAAASSAHANCFVTGDKALLDLGQVGTLPIVSPRQAYQRLRGLA